MGSQPAGSEWNASSCSSGRAWTERPMETRPGVPHNGGNGLVFDRPRSKRDPVHREGSGVPQNGGNGPPTVETGVLLIGRGVAYRKTEETDLCWSATVETGVLFIGRGVAYRKTGLHGILFISTVDPLQPPRATVHPPSTSSSLHLRLFIHRLLFIQPPPCATPPAIVHPAPTGSIDRVLFIQRQHHGVLFIHPHWELFIQPPSNAHCSSRGSIDRLQLAAVAIDQIGRAHV